MPSRHAFRSCLLALVLVLLPLFVRAQGTTGGVSGRVLDKATGRGLAGVRVAVQVAAPATGPAVETDVEGRFALRGLPVGKVRIAARLIGFRPVVADSVAVEAGKTTPLNFTLESAPLQLEEVVVESAEQAKATSSAGLLALQQSAASASDGLSQEQIEKAPDASAGDAVARISGVSVVGNKFLVVRGLDERYNNTLINGSEVASPEPLKRVVPLDIFSSSLLESIVTTKSATPDRPGDFAGASVDIKTRDFPEEFTFSLKVSQDYNSETTFRPTLLGERTVGDFFAFGAGRRTAAAPYPVNNVPPTSPTEPATIRGARFGEAIRPVWSPARRDPVPNLGYGLNLGGAKPWGTYSKFGYVLSGNYSRSAQALRGQVNRLLSAAAGQPGALPFALDVLGESGNVGVEWGGIANFALQLGRTNKVTWKNFYNRGSDETFAEAVVSRPALNPPQTLVREYGVRYVERSSLQTQLAGDHTVADRVRFEWRGSYSLATRDEPENRNLRRALQTADGVERFFLNNDPFQFRFLNETALSAQVDLSTPFTLWNPRDGLLKIGGLARNRRRDFDGTLIRIRPLPESAASGPSILPGVDTLSIDRFWSPEVIASRVSFVNAGSSANSYAADDNIRSAYAMVDAHLLPRLRAVGGARLEDWTLDIAYPRRPGSGFPFGYLPSDSAFLSTSAFAPRTLSRANRDILPSVNLTYELGDRMNIRAAAFEAVSRPDARELTPEVYFGIGGLCSQQGNADLIRTKIRNADVKWEFFPRAGEILSLSGYYKRFNRPTVTITDFPNNEACQFTFGQAREAEAYGGEVEVRSRLDVLTPFLSAITFGANVSIIRSKALLDSVTTSGIRGTQSAAFQGQSPYLLNFSLGYDSPSGAVSATVLYNYFADRVSQYGALRQAAPGQTSSERIPDIFEQGRATLDARLRFRFSESISVSLSGRNLTNNRIVFTQVSPTGQLFRTGDTRNGTNVSVGVTYDY